MRYEYFTNLELRCPCCKQNRMNHHFMKKIVAIREELGLPIIVTSAYRCGRQNTKVGGSGRSAHLDGLAIDIARRDGSYTRKIVELAIKYGIHGIEIGTRHTHLDDKDRGSAVIWAGISN